MMKIETEKKSWTFKAFIFPYNWDFLELSEGDPLEELKSNIFYQKSDADEDLEEVEIEISIKRKRGIGA